MKALVALVLGARAARLATVRAAAHAYPSRRCTSRLDVDRHRKYSTSSIASFDSATMTARGLRVPAPSCSFRRTLLTSCRACGACGACGAQRARPWFFFDGHRKAIWQRSTSNLFGGTSSHPQTSSGCTGNRAPSSTRTETPRALPLLPSRFEASPPPLPYDSM